MFVVRGATTNVVQMEQQDSTHQQFEPSVLNMISEGENEDEEGAG